MRLADYPYVLVRISCDRCGRAGQYRLARLAAAYGPETDVDAVVEALSRDCVYRVDRGGP